jgi:hypothetical protein
VRDRPGVVGLTIMAGPEPNDIRPDDYSEQDGDNGDAQHAAQARPKTKISEFGVHVMRRGHCKLL